MMQRGVCNLSLKDAVIQAWSDMIGVYRICSFIAWTRCYFKTGFICEVGNENNKISPGFVAHQIQV